MPQAALGRAGEKSRSRTFSATGIRWFESVVRTNRRTVFARIPWAVITLATVLTQQVTPRAFNSMASELAETDKVRRDLVANVSHELRTPITALQAALENLVDGVAEPDPETFRTMLLQVERLGRLVTQLLDLSRLESGVVPLDRSEFRVEPLIAHAVREQLLHEPVVDLAVDVEPADLTADGDPERVHQVVANLLENAVRYSPTGGTVEVRARGSVDGVVIEILDEGPGIPEAERTRVFERFERIDPARTSANGGAGLGLSIARWIVDLHGGDIHPENREPHGCRMVVTLPAPNGRTN